MQKRKELAKGDFRTKHTNWGHLLLGIGVLIGVEGPVNTYLRAGEASLPIWMSAHSSVMHAKHWGKAAARPGDCCICVCIGSL